MSEYRLGDYNRGGMIAFMFSMVFTMAFFLYIAFIHPGVELNEMQVQQIKQEQQKEEAGAESQAAPTAEPAPAAEEAAPAAQ